MNATVVVVGGGYGGIVAAKALDEVADVVLVEPKDTFVHNVAALRGLVDPIWTDRMFLPYSSLLARGAVRRDRAVEVDGTTVVLGSGERIDADYVVLASGSVYPFPAKVDVDESAAARDRIRATHDHLAAASSVLLLGAGPAGLELAGEIRAMWADKRITVVDPAPDILAGAMPEAFREELRHQLDEMAIAVILGSPLTADPPTAPGEPGAFAVTTRDGWTVEADLWFRCHGVVPTTDYLAGSLAAARRSDGHLEVTDDLRVAGHERVFAIGDVTAVPEAKMAKAAEIHGGLVAGNIATMIDGGGDLGSYQPGPPGMSLPLGPKGGASYAESVGVLGADRTSELKGADLRVDVYRERLGLA